jgi:hypothetical protein
MQGTGQPLLIQLQRPMQIKNGTTAPGGGHNKEFGRWFDS